jgi:hypothetical protein
MRFLELGQSAERGEKEWDETHLATFAEGLVGHRKIQTKFRAFCGILAPRQRSSHAAAGISANSY